MRALTNGGYLLRSNPNRLRLADHARLAQSDKNVFEQMRRPSSTKSRMVKTPKSESDTGFTLVAEGRELRRQKISMQLLA
jgi:hypothetical protein